MSVQFLSKSQVVDTPASHSESPEIGDPVFSLLLSIRTFTVTYRS